MYTTLNQIRTHKPCPEGWEKLLRYLGKTKPDDEPVAIATILMSNGLDDALWSLRSLVGHEREMRLLAVSFVREVQHLRADLRSSTTSGVAEAFANGQASQENLEAARLAAGAAYAAARPAAYAAAKDRQATLLIKALAAFANLAAKDRQATLLIKALTP